MLHTIGVDGSIGHSGFFRCSNRVGKRELKQRKSQQANLHEFHFLGPLCFLLQQVSTIDAVASGKPGVNV